MHPDTKLPEPQGLLRDSKKEERRSHSSSAFSTSFCQLLADAHYQSRGEAERGVAATLHPCHAALPVAAMCPCALQRFSHFDPGRQCQAVYALLTQMLSAALSPGRPFPGKPC